MYLRKIAKNVIQIHLFAMAKLALYLASTRQNYYVVPSQNNLALKYISYLDHKQTLEVVR